MTWTVENLKRLNQKSIYIVMSFTWSIYTDFKSSKHTPIPGSSIECYAILEVVLITKCV